MPRSGGAYSRSSSANGSSREGHYEQADDQIKRGAKQLARKECANYADGSCLPDDCPCHVLNPAYKTIHDGAVNCDHFIFAVQPQQPELNAAFWHEIYREEDEVGKGWKECVRCHRPFLPASNRQRYCAECEAVAKQARSREKQRRYREKLENVCVALPFRTRIVQKNQGFPDTSAGQDDLLAVLHRFGPNKDYN